MGGRRGRGRPGGGGILFFSSPIGLGHAARDLAVAEALAEAPAVGVRFVSGGAAADFLAGQGLETNGVYRPPHFSVRGGALGGAGRWLASYYRYYRRCLRAARRLIALHRPRMVVSDEDFASLSAAHEAGVRTALITDVFETRFCQGWPGARIESLMNASMRRIVSRCGAVLAPFERGSAEAAAAAAACPRVQAVGPVVRRPRGPRGRLRARLGMEGPTVLACAGGTGAGRFVLDAAERAAEGFGGADVVVACGPSLPVLGRAGGGGGWRDYLREYNAESLPLLGRAGGGGGGGGGRIRRIGAVPNLHEYVYAADAVVSLAGRSTMDECRQYGTPGVFIPIRGHFEQEDNAAGAGFAHEDVGRLGELVRTALAGGRAAEAAWVGEDGAGERLHSPGALGAAGAILEAYYGGGGRQGGGAAPAPAPPGADSL